MRLKRFVLGACLLFSIGCRPGVAQDGSSPAKPPSPQEQVTHKNPVVIPKMVKPAPLELYTDPAFGTKITRISDAAPGQVVKPMYNTVQSWNADESLLLLYHTGAGGPGHHLYDGKTYVYRRALDISPRDLEEVYWDTGDPNLFTTSASRLKPTAP